MILVLETVEYPHGWLAAMCFYMNISLFVVAWVLKQVSLTLLYKVSLSKGQIRSPEIAHQALRLGYII